MGQNRHYGQSGGGLPRALIRLGEMAARKLLIPGERSRQTFGGSQLPCYNASTREGRSDAALAMAQQDGDEKQLSGTLIAR
jgi:hypothetical protein